jgi:hypothetical protein
MFNARSDRIADAVRLLVAGVAVAADPTLMSALKTAPSAYDALKKLAAAPPASVGRLAEALAADARTVFAARGDLPKDADLLYLQMVEIGLVEATEIVAAGMDEIEVTRAMLSKLTDREHKSTQMVKLFEELTVPPMKRLLADKAFAADLTPAFMKAMLGEMRGLLARFDRLERMTRLEMEGVARDFGIERISELTDDSLRNALRNCAEEYHRLLEEIAVLRATIPRIDSSLTEVEALLERLDFAAAEALLFDLVRKPVEDSVRIMEVQARVALLRGATEDGFRILSAAADAFTSLDRLEPARRRLQYGRQLFDSESQGLGYPQFAIEIIRASIEAIEGASPPHEKVARLLYSDAQIALGTALLERGTKLGDKADVAAAVGARCMALKAISGFGTREQIAACRVSLAEPLLDLSRRQGGSKGAIKADRVVTLLQEAAREFDASGALAQRAIVHDWIASAYVVLGELRPDNRLAYLRAEVAARRLSLGVEVKDGGGRARGLAWLGMGQALIRLSKQVPAAQRASVIDDAIRSLDLSLPLLEGSHPLALAQALLSKGIALKTRAYGGALDDRAMTLSDADGCIRQAYAVFPMVKLVYPFELEPETPPDSIPDSA